MPRRHLLLVAACAGILGLTSPAQSVSLPVVPSTATCEQFSDVTCSSTNPGVNADILQNASDTRDQVASLLGLGRAWRFPVHLHVVMPDDPLADRIKEERSAVTASGDKMILEAALPFSDPDLKDFIRRQYVTALLWEKFFANTHSFDTHTNLSVVPLWLVEGLTDCLSDDPGRFREGIVRRAALIHRTPTLRDVMDWQEISDDRLLGLYQSAFCYYLVNGLMHDNQERAEFQSWLATFASADSARGGAFLPSEATWQRQLLDAPARSHDLIFSWEDSATALADAEAIAIPGAKPSDTRIGTMDGVAGFPRDEKLVAVLRKKVFDLTALELRVHPSWRPIFGLYRFGLMAVIHGQSAKAAGYLQEAQHRRAVEEEYHRKLTDYVNWFEVTKDYTEHASHFDLYFSTAHEIEEMQVDPDRPNPIRSHLLQVESQL